MNTDDEVNAHRLAGKLALVTGASRGIGLAIAHRLVAEGARVCITARTPEPLAAAATSLPDGTAIFVAGKSRSPRRRVRCSAGPTRQACRRALIRLTMCQQ